MAEDLLSKQLAEAPLIAEVHSFYYDYPEPKIAVCGTARLLANEIVCYFAYRPSKTLFVQPCKFIRDATPPFTKTLGRGYIVKCSMRYMPVSRAVLEDDVAEFQKSTTGQTLNRSPPSEVVRNFTLRRGGAVGLHADSHNGNITLQN